MSNDPAAATPVISSPDRPAAGTALAVFALTLSLATAVLVLRAPESPARPVLIYDAAEVSAQARPYVDAGYPANDVVEQAFAAALARGHVILRRSDTVAGGPDLAFRLADFVAPPETPPETPPESPPETARGSEPPAGPVATPLAPKDAGRVLVEPLPGEVRDLFEQLPSARDGAPDN